jgi:DegV family protein with EDD domain
MAKLAFVTDSTAYLPDPLVKKYNITVVPQLLIWGDQTYQDGVDIKPQDFYSRLQTTRTMPTTSQVPAILMESVFGDLVKKGFDVLGVFISSKLSGTVQSALRGQEALGIGAEKVTVVDSNSTSMAMGFQILAAVRAAEAGASPSDCKDLIDKARDHVGVYFALDTLEFIHRGGRIGGAQRFIGSALNLKPILALKDGRVEPEDRVRTMRKALDHIIDLVAERVKDKPNIRMATLHANAEREATDLLERAGRLFHPIESLISSVSPVVGTHAGPGTIGLAFMEGI